jgi:CHAT domain-containing protein/Tfp pilus assembly protein PilF
VARSIAAGESVAYDLDLAAGRYLRIALRQKGLRIGATLQGPAGEPLAVAGRSVRRTVKLLSLVTGRAGRYRLSLAAAPGSGAQGAYELAIEDLRAEKPGDRSRLAAERAMAEGLAARRIALPGLDLRTHAKFEEARRLYHQAQDFEGETDARIESCSVAIDQGNPAAERAADELARLHSSALQKGYLRGAAAALDPLDYAQDNLGRTREAIATGLQGFALWQRVGDVAAAGETASDLGFFYLRLPAYGEARRWLDTALALRQEAGDVEGEARTWLGLGLLHHAEYDLDAAAEAGQKARKLFRQAGNRPQESQATGNLATVYQNRGDLQGALDLYAEAIAVGEGDPALQGQYYQNLGSLYVELGNLDQARTSYKEALHLLPEATPLDFKYRINALVNLGSILLSLEGPEKARVQYQRALDLSRDPSLESQRALALHSMGKADLQRERPGPALGSLTLALAIRTRLQDQQGMAKTLLEMGNAHRALGDLSRAAEYFDHALKLARQIHRFALEAACQLQLARLDRDLGHLELARQRIEPILGELEKARSRFVRDQTRILFFATLRDYYELYIGLLVDLAERHPGGHYLELALQASEGARARALLDLLAEGRIDVRSGESSALQEKASALDRDLYKTQVQANASSREDRLEDLDRRLLEIEQHEEDLASAIRRQDPRFAEVRYPAPLGAAAIERTLGPRTALLEYSLGSRESFLFVVTRGGLTCYRLPPAAEIEAAVVRLRAAIAKPTVLERVSLLDEATSLYQVLIAPANGVLAPLHDLLVVPDGTLHLLPFEVLLTDPGAARSNLPWSELPYLLRRHTISYVPSASVLQGLRTLRPAAAPRSRALAFLAFAAPLTRLAPLPRSRDEVEEIARLYPPAAVKLYMDRMANKGNVVGNPLLPTARGVYFATHGIFDERNPALSGLALTPGAGDDDGVLRVSEVFNLKLAADLVVLSACDTGAGKRVTGEGLVGLSRAFFYAGTPSLVVSLWSVSESSAPQLMPDFYRRLNTGLGKGEALRESKLAMIRNTTYAHPFHWAPFVLLGDPK